MIAAIENAILARLRAAADSGALGYRWGSLETYPEDWDKYLKDKGGLIRAPAAWVTFGGWGAPQSSGYGVRLPATFGVVVMGENLRNEQASRHGDGVDATKPGSYQLLEDVITLLNGERLELDIDTLRVGSARFVPSFAALKERKVSMLAVQFMTGFAAPAPKLEDFDDFHTAHFNWDVPGFGGIDAAPGTHGIQLPDDAHADATDHVELETLV